MRKFKDNGSGIPSLVNLLVAQINEKDGVVDTGFFGSGFLSVFEESDIVNIKTSDGSGVTKYLEMSVRRDKSGDFLGFDIQGYRQTEELFSGTEIESKTKVGRNKIAEFEYAITKSAILKNVANLQSFLDDGTEIKIYFNSEKLEKGTQTRRVETFSVDSDTFTLKIEEGAFSQVSSGEGLRMSDLDEKYLALVPRQIRSLVHEKNLSLIIDGKIPLIKDRSMIADEPKYLPAIQKAVAQGVIKIAIKELLENRRKFEGWPDDYLVNYNYHMSYNSAEGKRIIEIARKINAGMELGDDDLKFISVDGVDKDSIFARLAVLINVEIEREDGKRETTSLAAKRLLGFRNVARDDNMEHIRKVIQREKDILHAAETYMPDKDIVPSSIDVSRRKIKETIKMFDEAGTSVNIDSLNDRERQVFDAIEGLVQKVYPSVILMVKEMKRKAGYSSGDTIVFARNTLSNERYATEVLNHELAHYLEGTGGHDKNFTHQVDGSFGDAYREANRALLSVFAT